MKTIVVSWMRARLSEPSTWRGIFALLTAAGVAVATQDQEAIIAGGLALMGLIGVTTKG